jgi:PAS domain S-box-containing protein
MYILHLEDSPNDAELIARVLRREWPQCEIRHVTSAEEYRAALNAGCFDVILSDYSMPGYDGLLALGDARRNAPQTPFLFLSGMIGEERAVEALKRGATDYIIKDRPARLVPAIRQALAFVSEATRRRESEEALRSNDERFRLITENIGDLITVLGLDGRACYANAACRALLGEDAVGEGSNWFQSIDPQDLLRVRCALDRVMATGVAERFEFRHRLGHGAIRHMDANGAVLRNGAGRVANILIVARDMTERRHAEARLREQASLLDKARDAIFATDLELRVTYWNASAERLYGVSSADVLGRKLNETGIGFVPGAISATIAAVREKGEWRGELRIQTKRGAALLVESTWSLVIDEGQPRSFLAIGTDVTERRKLESQLLRAQRLESVGTLAGGVAHDLNNVFTPVLLALDLLAPKASSSDERQIVEKTRASVSHGAALVRQLLAFARGAEGERVRLDPVAAIRGVEPLIRQWLPASIELLVLRNQRSAFIEANVTQVNQALVNLALNARDAMPAGGRLEIAIENVTVDPALAAANPGTEPGPFVRIRVSDTGTGIAPDVVDRVFDPFFTTKPPGKGTGLGLSMVAGILKNHGGFVQVDSEVGRGTTFHLYFPAHSEQPAAANIDQAPRPASTGHGVLLVDDEPAVRDALRALLQRAGYEIFPAADAGSALREYEHCRDKISLVITDMMLPDASGVEVVKSLRAQSPTLPIIAISGMMASGKYDELLRLDPPVECLSKPLPPRILLGAAERALHVAS